MRIDNYIVNTETVAKKGKVKCKECGEDVPATFIDLNAHDHSKKNEKNVENFVFLQTNFNIERT